MPRRSSTRRVPECGRSPACHEPVPAESASMAPSSPAARTLCIKTASAIGERQMLPRQTKRTRTMVQRLPFKIESALPGAGPVRYIVPERRAGRRLRAKHVLRSVAVERPGINRTDGGADMITHTRRIFGTLIALAALGATSAVLRMRPAAAQTRGVLNEHIDILRRNAAALRDHDAAVLDADLTPDFVHEDALGGKTNRKGEIDALRALFRSGAWLSEAALPVRLTVQGGDANSPTVATMLVQATRTAGQRAADG